MTVFFYLWISVALNGENWEAIPAKFYTMEDCQEYAKTYKGITNKAPICFPATEMAMRAAGLKP